MQIKSHRIFKTSYWNVPYKFIKHHSEQYLFFVYGAVCMNIIIAHNLFKVFEFYIIDYIIICMNWSHLQLKK